MKDAGPRRVCPVCLGLFQETMPVGSGTNVRWVPRPACTQHNLNADGVPTDLLRDVQAGVCSMPKEFT